MTIEPRITSVGLHRRWRALRRALAYATVTSVDLAVVRAAMGEAREAAARLRVGARSGWLDLAEELRLGDPELVRLAGGGVSSPARARRWLV